MKRQIGKAIVAVLLLKQQRLQRALHEISVVEDQIRELLDVKPGEIVRGHQATDYVVDFLNGTQEPLELCRLLEIEVTP
jgi:hypothetical protein